MSACLTIAKVAARSGFSVPTLRFYEQQGLIPPVPRDAVGNRLYGEREMSRVNTIRCLKAAGLTLPEMKRYFDLVEQGESTMPERRELLLQTRENLRRQHAEIQKCMLYLAQKISYYDVSIEAMEKGEDLPLYQFGAFNGIFSDEDGEAQISARPGHSHCPGARHT